MFSLMLCVSVSVRTQSHWFEWAEAEKCIRLVREKLRIFPYGQYIVENVVLLADDIVRFKIEVRVEEKCTKM